MAEHKEATFDGEQVVVDGVSAEEKTLLDEVVRETKLRGDPVYARMTGDDPLADVWRLGKLIAESGLFGVNNPAQAAVLALEAYHQQRPVTELARRYHVIEGRLSMRADAMQAEFQADKGRVRWLESTGAVCRAEFSHPDFAPEPVEVEVTFAEMDRVGITKGKSGLKKNWRQFPRQMLRARAISEGVRMVHPGIVVGVYSPEEVSDFDLREVPLETPPARPAVNRGAQRDTNPASKPAPRQEQEQEQERRQSRDRAPEPQEERERQEPAQASEVLPVWITKAMRALKPLGVLREDLEGDGGRGLALPATAWDEGEHKPLVMAIYRELMAVAPGERPKLVRELFELGAGAEG